MGVDRAAEIIAEWGSDMVLRRATEATTISLKGKRIPGSIEETGNSAAQQVFGVKIAATEILASAWADKFPKRDDSIRINERDHTLLDARPLKHMGVLYLYELTVAG
jgi:hypothetical protein